MNLTADFETTTQTEDCRVWAFAICEVDNPNNFIYGNSMDGFFEILKNHIGDNFYFHNLKFDGEFIIHYLFTHGWIFNEDEKKLKKNQFTTLISDKGMFYSMKLCFDVKGNRKKYVNIYDSLKIIPFSVEQVAKTFGLPISKLEIDYNEYREPGHTLTENEVEYIKNDVRIMAMALKVLFNQGLNKMTQGGNALNDYKIITGKKNFDRYFPCSGIRSRYETVLQRRIHISKEGLRIA